MTATTMLLIGVYLLLFYIQNVQTALDFQSKTQASTFLRQGHRHARSSEAYEECRESYGDKTCTPTGSCSTGFHPDMKNDGCCTCEDKDECHDDICKAGMASCTNTPGSYTCSCKPGYAGRQCQTMTNKCLSYPCLNGGSCTSHSDSFTCMCVKGFTGARCENIDYCASAPCQNNATCHDLDDTFRCECPTRFYGARCETNICHPTPADVIFILDSSESMSEAQFRKQLDFVDNFVDHVIIGPRDFQIAVVTYSFDAHVEFYLNDHRGNATVKDAIRRISYKPGATFTDKGLETITEIFRQEHGGERNINGSVPARFVFLLTDGMSTDRHETSRVAARIKRLYKSYKFMLSVIGIGNEVSHQELLAIASDPSLVYSVQDFDSLYTVLKTLVHYTCDECATSSVTDVAVIVDTSPSITEGSLHVCLDAMDYLIGYIDLHVNKTRVSMTSYDVRIKTILNFTTDRSGIIKKINTVQKTENTKRGTSFSVEDMLGYIESTIFSTARVSAKKVAIVFTNGHLDSPSQSTLMAMKRMLKNQNITVAAVGCGKDVDLKGLRYFVEDPFDNFIVQSHDNFDNLKVLKSYFTYNVCDFHGK